MTEHGTSGDAEIMSPTEIANTLEAMDQVQPLAFTDAEQAAWDTARQARKQRDKAEFAQHSEKLRGMWD